MKKAPRNCAYKIEDGRSEAQSDASEPFSSPYSHIKIKNTVNDMTTQPRSQFFTTHVLRLALCGLFTCSLLIGSFGATATAQPSQNPTATVASDGDAVTTSELAKMLASPMNAERAEALRRVVVLARQSPEVDLTPTVSGLTTIYKDDPNDENRVVAVAALSVIGSEAGLRQVRTRFLRDPSLMVQYVSLHALIDHYGPDVFAGDRKELALAKNVLARKEEAGRLGQVRWAAPRLAEER